MKSRVDMEQRRESEDLKLPVLLACLLPHQAWLRVFRERLLDSVAGLTG